MLELVTKTLLQVLVTFSHTWPYLGLSVLVAAALKVHVEPARLRAWLARHQRASVIGAIGLAVLTPLCSCGTMALVLAMLATSMPWAPIVAFMVASPLTSPSQLLFTAGLFGWAFAGFHLVVAIGLGFAGAAAATVLESRGWLANQLRLAPPTLAPIGGGSGAVLSTELTAPARPGLGEYAHASLPLVKSFLDSGASAGAAMAFLITGAGTSVGAVVGALTIARWRVLAVVVATLWVGAIISGYVFDALAAGKLY